MNELLAAEGAEIDGFYYCPHHPVHGIGSYKKECSCRKPGIGMFLQAEERFTADKSHSYMIGDKLLDTQAGKNLRCDLHSGRNGILGRSFMKPVGRRRMKRPHMIIMQRICPRLRTGF